MTIYTMLRLMEQRHVLDERIATVATAHGTLYSAKYAVSFVRKYAYDESQLKHIFGGAYDLEELQMEMIAAMLKAAHAFLKSGTYGNWKAYLSHCLKTRLWDLSTKDDRRASHNFRYESLEMRLNKVLQLDPYTGDNYADVYPSALVFEDAYAELDSFNTARAFLQELTPRQRNIILLQWEHIPGTQDGATNEDVAEMLGITSKTVERELLKIQRAYSEYATTREPSWFPALKRIENRWK